MAARDVATRVRSALPGLDISSSVDIVRRRAREWWWPSVQMGLAAALSWLVASHLAGSAASYAPIAAIVALGLGRERRLSRSALMLGGLFAGVVAAELATRLIGIGWWQIGVLMTLTALITGALIGRDLAVLYAMINAVVLLTTPGSDGWMPLRLFAGLIGVSTAIAVMLVLMPAHPVRLVERRLHRAAERTIEALDATAHVLRDGEAADDGLGDGRRLLWCARRVDDELERSHETVDQARELVRWSPIRRLKKAEVVRLCATAEQVQPTLRTASTIARLGDRAKTLGLRAGSGLTDALRCAADVVRELRDHLVEDRPMHQDQAADVRSTLDALMSEDAEHAVMMALVEEVRGLLDDLAEIGDRRFGDPAVRFPGVRRGDGIAYGNA